MRILRHENTFSLIFADAKVSFPHVIETTTNNANPKAPFEEYSVDILIPKSTDMTDFEAVVKEIIADKWEGATPAFRYEYLKDGDKKKTRDGEQYEEYANHWYITARTSEDKKPLVIDMAKNELVKKDDIVGGDVCHIFCGCYAYDTAGNRGISFPLNTVKLKEKAANPFGGGISNNAAANAMDALDNDDLSI